MNLPTHPIRITAAAALAISLAMPLSPLAAQPPGALPVPQDPNGTVPRPSPHRTDLMIPPPPPPQEPLAAPFNPPVPSGLALPDPSVSADELTPGPSRLSRVYEVKPGESILSIARRFGVSAEELKAVNSKYSDLLVVGEQLRIPQPGGSLPSPSTDPASGSPFPGNPTPRFPGFPSNGSPIPTGVEVTQSPLLHDKRFDVKFENSTAGEIASYLCDQVPGLNIMLPGDTGNARLPSMSLREVNLAEFMAAVSAASKADMNSGNDGYSLEPVPGAPNILIFQQIARPGRAPFAANSFSTGPAVAGMPGVAGGSGFGIGGGGADPFGGPPSAGSRTESTFFDLSTILKAGGLQVDDITTAIRTAWSSVETGKAPPEGALKFHEETQLLIVTASPEFLQSATNIVTLLQSRTKPSREEKDMQIAQVRQQMENLQMNRARIEEDFKEQQARSHEIVAKLQARITELEIELAKAHNKVEN